MTTFFHGKYINKIDRKGRISIPAKFRDIFLSEGNNVYLLKRDGCIHVFPEKKMEEFAKDVMNLSAQENNAIKYQRLFFANSEIVEMKPMGRLTIPIHFREYAALTTEVIIIGAGRWIEIWDKKNWEKEISDSKSTIEALSQIVYGNKI
jgi:MraZ protein